MKASVRAVGAEGGGDDRVADEAEAAAEDVAQGNHGGRAEQAAAGRPRCYPVRWTSMALLARFACGCTRRVEIPAPAAVRCALHGCIARLITTPRGQVRYVAVPGPLHDDTPPGADRA